ncbi:MAG: hypothetical protein ABW321_22130 [Polyangiales bacterium]
MLLSACALTRCVMDTEPNSTPSRQTSPRELPPQDDAGAEPGNDAEDAGG